MPLPHYLNGSIVNIMSAIEMTYGMDPLYEPLKGLEPDDMMDYDNIVLMVIDGLGYEYLKRHQRGSLIEKNIKKRVTSVFPTTTSAGITSFATGKAPQQHAITGWFMYLKEMGVVSQILPFCPRFGGMKFSDVGVEPSMLIDVDSVFDNLPVASYCIVKEDIINSDYSNYLSGSSFRSSYHDLEGYYGSIRESIGLHEERKFIYAYWSHFDTMCHKYGTSNESTNAHFKEIDANLKIFLESVEGTNSLVILTADHGLIDVGRMSNVDMRDHPDLADTLALPLCGEARAAFCYVRPFRTRDFERYVRRELDGFCTLHKSTDLIKKNYFGLYEPNIKLYDRVGDYVLMMKDNYIIKDSLLGEDEHWMIGYHGGLSKEELYVPLSTFDV